MFVKKYSQFLFVISLILLLSLGYLFFFKISPESLSEISGKVIFSNPEKELSKSFSLASLTIFSFMLWLIVEKKG